MMHSTLHFSIGILVGTALSYRPIRTAVQNNAPLAAPLRRWLMLAYALGLFAIVPNLLRRAGVPHALCESCVMNLFLLSPALNHLVRGGAIYGPLILGIILMSQYLTLLWALRRALRSHN